MSSDIPTCKLCGIFGRALVDVVWENAPARLPEWANPATTKRLRIAKPGEKAEATVCDDCIRDIKRIPFSDMKEVYIPF